MKGDGNQQDYGMRIYDPRVGRILSVDPLTKDYPELTPYQFASNRPMDGIDLDGGEWKTQHHWNEKVTGAHIKLLGSDYKKGMTYKDAYRVMIPKVLEKSIGKKINCADLAIEALVEIAYTFKLPVYFEDNKTPQYKDPTFDNSNFGFTRPNGQKISFKPGEWQRLADNIKAYYGAGDIFNREPIAKEKLGGLAAQLQGLKVGDLVSWKHPKKPKEQQEFHTQTVTEINKPWYWYDSYTTIQCNLNDSGDLPARETSYDFEDILTRVKEKGENIKVKEWNFNEFDKKRKP